MKILVTGGPVHAHLDSIKIITNAFRGGRMLGLALELQALGCEVVYLTAEHMKSEVQKTFRNLAVWKRPEILMHKGFLDYEEQILTLTASLEFDAIVLGAAVANLVPVNPWPGKFPSHTYKPGDTLDIKFMVAPRVIDQVKRHAPKTKLFGFKLLDGAPEEELVEAAYDIVLASGAVAVFANDRQNLDHKLAVTKERSVIPLEPDELAKFIKECAEDEYYQTLEVGQLPLTMLPSMQAAVERCTELLQRYEDKFAKTYGKNEYVFGTVATRLLGSPLTFLTTKRGKTKGTRWWTHVVSVDHEKRCVHVVGPKATLNAPLLHWLFKHNEQLQSIVHFHGEAPETTTSVPWYPPGTVRDSQRLPELAGEPGFRIRHHGVFLLFEDGQ